MLMKPKYLILVFIATAFGLFGMPERAKTDAITVGRVSQVPGKLQISGNGTFSVDQGRQLKSITMNVLNLGGMNVSSTAGTVPKGTTEWASNSNVLPAGTYYVTVEITTTDAQGNNPITTQGQNGMQITIK